jgi:hypothetical protein
MVSNIKHIAITHVEGGEEGAHMTVFYFNTAA